MTDARRTRPRRRRFLPLLARRADTLLALSIAFLIAAVLGVQLGRSTIAQIDPIHFRGVAAAPRGIDANAPRPAPDPYLSAYGWDEGHAARARDCGGDCDAREARQALVHAVTAPARAERATRAAAPAPWQAGETAARPLSVEPYMHYPIEATPANAAEADEEPAGALISD